MSRGEPPDHADDVGPDHDAIRDDAAPADATAIWFADCSACGKTVAARGPCRVPGIWVRCRDCRSIAWCDDKVARWSDL